MVVTDVSKSSTSALIETFIADWSSTMTNWAMANATSGNQFTFGVGAASVASDSPVVTVAPLLAISRTVADPAPFYLTPLG